MELGDLGFGMPISGVALGYYGYGFCSLGVSARTSFRTLRMPG